MNPFTFTESLPDGTTVVTGHVLDSRPYFIDNPAAKSPSSHRFHPPQLRVIVIPCECCRRPSAWHRRSTRLADAGWTPLFEGAGFIENVFIELPSTKMHAMIRPMVACSDECERSILTALGRDPSQAGIR